MNTPETVTIEMALTVLKKLSPRDRLNAIAQVLAETGDELPDNPSKKRSLKGVWKGVKVSAQDIEEARQDMWGNFPHEDIG